jgi:hypothetical protein
MSGQPLAWRWLDTAVFRRRLPKTAEPGAWSPVHDDTALLKRALNALTELEYGNTNKAVAMATAAIAALRERLEVRT